MGIFLQLKSGRVCGEMVYKTPLSFLKKTTGPLVKLKSVIQDHSYIDSLHLSYILTSHIFKFITA